MLEALVLARLGRIHQHHRITSLHEAINQPVPIEGAFHGHAADVGSIGLQGLQCHRQVVGQALLENELIVFVDDRQEVIV
jgi:hypothetical protein